MFLFFISTANNIESRRKGKKRESSSIRLTSQLIGIAANKIAAMKAIFLLFYLRSAIL
jgi:hypothetical protein